MSTQEGAPCPRLLDNSRRGDCKCLYQGLRVPDWRRLSMSRDFCLVEHIRSCPITCGRSMSQVCMLKEVRNFSSCFTVEKVPPFWKYDQNILGFHPHGFTSSINPYCYYERVLVSRISYFFDRNINFRRSMWRHISQTGQTSDERFKSDDRFLRKFGVDANDFFQNFFIPKTRKTRFHFFLAKIEAGGKNCPCYWAHYYFCLRSGPLCHCRSSYQSDPIRNRPDPNPPNEMQFINPRR